MQRHRLILCFLFVLLISFIVLGICVQADEAGDDVEGSFTVSIVDGSSFLVTFTGDVDEVLLTASGKSYSKTEIQSISQSYPEVMGAIKYAIMTKVTDQIHQSFPQAIIASETELPQYQQQLFQDEYLIELTADFFDFNDSVDASNFINGLLNIGAFVNYSFPLSSLEGWNNSYRFVLSDSIGYKRTNGKVSGNEILWEIRNNEGQQPSKTGKVTLFFTSPTTPTTSNESIEVLFQIDAGNRGKTSLSTILSAYFIDISSFQIIPSFITNVEVIPADAVRLCVLNNFTDWNTFYQQTLYPLNQEIISFLETPDFNQSLDMDFQWNESVTNQSEDPYNITQMDEIPPVMGEFTDEDIDLTICGLPSSAVFGLVNTGAELEISSDDVNIKSRFAQLNYTYRGVLFLPDHVFLEDSNNYEWDQNGSIQGSFSSDVAKSYDTQQIDSRISIEVKNTDLNLLSFFTGKTELTMGVHCRQTKHLNVTTLPTAFNLPEKISIDYLTADALRLCIDQQVFSQDQVSSYLEQQKQSFEEIAKGIIPSLKGGAQIDRDQFDQTIQWDENISSMHDLDPVELVNYMHSSYPLSFGFSVIPPSFNINIQNLTFSGIDGENVTYSLVFPAGISVMVNDSLDRVYTETVNGKTVVHLSFNETEGSLIDVVSISLYPTAFYIIGLFVPCIVSVIITVILFIVVYLIRKKRNQFHVDNSSRVPTEEDSFEDQDYYVPPPPKRR